MKPNMIETQWMAFVKGAILLSFTIVMSACSQESDSLIEPIELTTPVVALAHVHATVSRADETPTAMKLTVDLLKEDGNVLTYKDGLCRTSTYELDGTNWSVSTGSSPLVVTAGIGDYYARALASDVKVGEVTKAFYAYSGTSTELGTISVSTGGTFTLGSAMTPMTAAIKVELKNANGEDLNSDDYTITLFNLKKAEGISWENNGASLETTDLGEAGEVLSGKIGHFVTKEVSETESWQLMTIAKGGVTWTVYMVGSLTLNPGYIHILTVTLGGSSVINLNNTGITIGDFTDSEDGGISVER